MAGFFEQVKAGAHGTGPAKGGGVFARLVLPIMMLVVLAACSTTSTLEVPVPRSESPRYAAYVVDANTRQVLYAHSANETRYPASLTKMMTVYMMFEAIDAGRMSKSTQIECSAGAARQPPSKLGIKSGQTIDADTAIRALVTKSANDVATAVAEHLGGSEDRFAGMMTAKARQLGMSGTVFRNASGLPDPAQRTTARDMAVLGMALRSRFPHHYHYFSQISFDYNGRAVRGHNEVLKSVAGADGIKTGYTRASGFNLVTSVNRGGRRVVAVVMGEDSAKQRNAHMEQLIARFLPQASMR